MTPLKPLGGATKRPPSALAAFAQTLNEPVAELSRPQPLALGGLKPLASLGASGDGSVKSSGQLGGLSPVKKPGEISALAAFAAATSLELNVDHTRETSGGFAAKKPAPLPLKSMAKAGSKRDDRQARPPLDDGSGSTSGEKQTREQESEGKLSEAPKGKEDRGVARDSETKELQAKESTSEAREESSDEDSMAEFACMDSDEDDDDEAKSSVSRGDADADDLYDHGEAEEEIGDKTRLRASERIFVPRTPKEPLLHATVAEDVRLLSQLLSQMTPTEVLETRDTEGRTVYHYAAMSKNSRVQAVVFEFINCYFALELESKAKEIKAKQRRLDNWRPVGEGAGSTWVAPSVKALQTASDGVVTDAYLQVIQAHDHHKRSFLHYSALNTCTSPLDTCLHLLKTVRRHSHHLLSKDQFDRSALDYAVMADNSAAIELWFTQLGLAKELNREDVDRLAQLVHSKPTQSLLSRLLEDADRIGFATRQVASTKKRGLPHDQPALGLGVQFTTKMQHSDSVRDVGKAGAGNSARLWSPLHKAAMYGNVEAVEALADQGADVNAYDVDGWTPLHHCAALGSPEHIVIAQSLLEHRANVNARSQHGRTPLHLVAMQKPSDTGGHGDPAHKDKEDTDGVKLAALLCAHGAKGELSDDEHCTPFLSAARAGNVCVARFLLEQGCNETVVDKTGGNALHIAAARGLEEMVRFLSRWDAEWSRWRHCKDHQGRLPRALAKSDAVTLAMDNLWHAARSGDPELVRHQLQAHKQHAKDKRERGKHLSVHDKTPVTSRTALHLLIDGFSSADQCRSPRKPKERETRAVQSIMTLVHAGAGLSAQDKWGITPLMLAACVDTPVLIENMLTSVTQDDLMQRDEDGNTALHYSYAFSRAQTSSLLEDLTDNADIANKLGKLPLAVTGFRQKLFPKGYRALLTKNARPVHQ